MPLSIQKILKVFGLCAQTNTHTHIYWCTIASDILGKGMRNQRKKKMYKQQQAKEMQANGKREIVIFLVS